MDDYIHKKQKIGLFKEDCVDALHCMVEDCQFFNLHLFFRNACL